MKWSLYPARNSPQAFVDWQRLNESVAGNHPALDGGFQSLLVRYFSEGEVLVALCEEAGVHVAGAIVEKRGRGIWSLYMPGQACIAPLIVGPGVDFGPLMRSLLNAIPGFCGLLRLHKVDPALQSIEKFEKIRHAEIEIYGTTFAIDLQGGFDDYWSSRHKSVRRDARRSLRQLEQNGLDCELEERRQAEQMRDAVRLHGELESSGWKGKEGTAIHVDNQQGAFYVDLLTAFAKKNGAVTFQLYFAGKLAASLLCISNGEMMIVLKTTYREDYSSMGPGRLIDYLSTERCFTDVQGKRIEMFTRASDTDLRWGTDQRPIYDINLFSNRAFKHAADLYRILSRVLRRKAK